MTAREVIQQATEEGVSQEEIQLWIARTRQNAEEKGVDAKEIDTYFGTLPVDDEPIRVHFRQSWEAAQAGGTKPPANLLEAFQAGAQSSVAGLVGRERLPSIVVDENTTRTNRIMAMATQLVLDSPLMATGAVIAVPGSVVTANPSIALGGAFALPAALRGALIEKYEGGEIDSFGRFWDVMTAALIEEFKAFTVGVTAGKAGQIAGLAAPALSVPTKLLSVPAEISTMVTIGAALEGEVPEIDDFIDAGILIGTARGAMHVAGRMRRTYVSTGKRPQDIVKDAEVDPTIIDDLNSSNIEIPRAYRAAVEQAKVGERTAAERQAQATPEIVNESVSRVEQALDKVRGRKLTPEEIEQQTTKGARAAEKAAIQAAGQIEAAAQRIEKIRATAETAEEGVSRAEIDLAQRQDMSVLENTLAKAEQSLESRLVTAPQALERLSQALGKARNVLQPVGITKEGERAAERLEVAAPAAETPTEHILSRISVGERAPKPGWSISDFYTDYVDRLHPLGKAVNMMREGRELKPVEDAYKLARLNVGIGGKASHFLEYSPFELKTFKRVGRPLKAILEPVKKNLDTLRTYAVAKRTLDLQRRGIKTGIDIDKARAEVAAQAEKMEPIRAELEQYQIHVLNYLRDSEIISSDAYKLMIETNKDYVPFFRAITDEGGAPGAGKGLKTRDPIREIKGSERIILDPIESIIKNTYFYLQLAERNEIGKAFVRLAERSKRFDVAEKAKPTVRGTKLDPKEIKKIVKQYTEAEGSEISDVALQRVLNEEISIFRKNALSPGKNQIAVYRKGKREVWDVDPKVFKVFEGMDGEGASQLVKILSVPTRLLRAGAIFSPEFIARNPLRDQFSAFIFSKHGFRPFVDFTRGIFELANKGDVYQDWLRSGGPMATMVSLDRQYLQKSVRDILGQKTFRERVRNVATSPIQALAILSEIAEQGTRVGEFRRGVPRDPGIRTKAQIQEAGFESREVTLDFGRIGARAVTANRLIAFFNAQVQGTDKTVRSFVDRPKETTAKVIGFITIPSVTLHLLHREDEWYKEMAGWQRDLFWLFPIGGTRDRPDHIARLPKPHELGIIFGSGAERLAESLISEDSGVFDDFMETVLKGFTPSFIPTAVLPPIETYFNRSVFRDRPVIPSQRERWLPEFQAFPYTTQLTQALGHHLAQLPGAQHSRLVSPAVIDNFVQGWTGGLGRHFLNLADKALREAGVLPDPPRPADTLADLPVIKAFFMRFPSASFKSVQDFYDGYDKQQQFIETLNGLEREGDPEAALRLAESGRVFENVTGIFDTMNDQARLIRMITLNPAMSPEEKRQIIDEHHFIRLEMAQEGLLQLEELRKIQ